MLGNKRRDIDADGIGGNGAQDEVFLGTAFELDMNGEAVLKGMGMEAWHDVEKNIGRHGKAGIAAHLME